MSSFGGADFESPGYEYLRSYQNMSNLYQKLLVLNYRGEFCHSYKCPPIHRYYFSLPCKNVNEQQFLFSCLCAWLIKDKCHMNLEMDPEEYGDYDSTIATILEALRLLLTPDAGSARRAESKKLIGFGPNRLKRGYGPEVIYTISILADRALEIKYNLVKADQGLRVTFFDKGLNSTQQNTDSITIGQPFVGGGLTTRPLGSYKLDDAKLLFDNEDKLIQSEREDFTALNNINKEDWYQQVERGTSALFSQVSTQTEGNYNCSSVHEPSILGFLGTIRESQNDATPLLEDITKCIDRQLQVLDNGDNIIQRNLSVQFRKLIHDYRDYTKEKRDQQAYTDAVTSKSDAFVNLNDQLENVTNRIETQIKNLNDGSKLDDLETQTRLLNEECKDLDVKVGLLLTVYSKRHSKLMSKTV